MYDQGGLPRENVFYNDHLNQQQNENETQGEHQQEANITDAASELFGESSLSGRTTETHFHSTDTQGNQVRQTLQQILFEDRCNTLCLSLQSFRKHHRNLKKWVSIILCAALFLRITSVN